MRRWSPSQLLSDWSILTWNDRRLLLWMSRRQDICHRDFLSSLLHDAHVRPKDGLDALRQAYAAIVDEARAEVATGREPDARALEARIRTVRKSADEGAQADRAERQAL